MGDIQFNGTPEEWDALVKKNKEKEEPKPTIKQVDYVAKKQERMYSEEEVLKLVDGAFHMYASSKRHDAKEWLVEQFKKKQDEMGYQNFRGYMVSIYARIYKR